MDHVLRVGRWLVRLGHHSRLAVLIALASIGHAHAAGTVALGPATYCLAYMSGVVSGYCSSTIRAACEDVFGAAYGAANPGYTAHLNGVDQCQLYNNGNYSHQAGNVVTTAPAGCPSNSTDNGAGACTCDSGYAANGGGTACVAVGQGCTPGRTSTRNLTVGYSRVSPSLRGNTPDPADMVGPITNPIGTTQCIGGCSMSVGALAQGWVSSTPGPTGLYRVSGDFVATDSGPCVARRCTN